MKNTSSKDMVKTKITTIGTEPKICPNVPVTKSSGAKAAIVVSTPMVTGLNTPRTPRRVAAVLWPKCSCSVIMFSPTTTASSTTMPRTMISPKREIMLMFTPNGAKNKNAPRKEMGTPMATQVARRKSNIITRNKNTKAKPSRPLRISRLNRWDKMSVWSSQTCTLAPDGG